MQKPIKVTLIVTCILVSSLLAYAEQEFGEVSFANSGPASAQKDFLTGLALLHNFEYEDAAERFQAAEKIAPDFAMAYWGEAMTQNHPVWHQEDVDAAREALKRLGATPEARLAKAPTEREKLYLHSVELLFGDGTKEERDRRYESVMEELHRKFPNDVDGSAFYALAILGTAEKGRDFATYMRAAGVLEEVFPQHPNHPGVVHYLIHCYDDSVHAPLGLRAARIYSKIAPEADHAQHMTSHIFLALGMWDEEIKANETAMAVVNRDRQKAGRPPALCGHYNEWLEYGYMQQGRVADARRVMDGCRQVAERAAANPALNQASGKGMMPGMSPAMMALDSYADMRANFLIDSQLWNDEAAHWTLPAGDFPFARITFDYTDALTAIHRGEIAAARETTSRADVDRETAVAWIKKQEMDAPSMPASLLILTGQLHALLASAEGKKEEALADLRRLAAEEHKLPLEFGPPSIYKPTDELLGELLLEMDRPMEAKAALDVALSRAPGRRPVLDALARVEKAMPATAAAAK